jgi:hypothetical protein
MRFAQVISQQIGDRRLIVHDQDALGHARRITRFCGRMVSGGVTVIGTRSKITCQKKK